MNVAKPTFDYDTLGHRYSVHRKADPRIHAYIDKALGNARTVLNVGAGAGSYEPSDRYVVALEPSATMRSQRLAAKKVPAIYGTAENIPFDDDSFDASMAIFTLHHWPDITKGLNELRRVTTGQIVLMTIDPDEYGKFWIQDYFPQLVEIEKKRFPAISTLKEHLGGHCEVCEIPIPFDCTDGFKEAFYGRPEAFFEKDVRKAQSAWGFLPEEIEKQYVQTLNDELASGEWDRKYGAYRNMPSFNGALRLVVAYKT